MRISRGLFLTAGFWILLIGSQDLRAAGSGILLRALGDGQQEVNPTGSTAFCAGLFEVDTAANRVSYRIIHSDLTSDETVAHIDKLSRG